MKSLAFATVGLLLAYGVGNAQTTQHSGSAATMGNPHTTLQPGSAGALGNVQNTLHSGTAGALGNNQTNQHSGTAAASGNDNQAVATTNNNAPMPAKGSNSFTMGEVKSRLQSEGYSNITNLTKNSNGVWRGKAQKGGTTASVWLDYKGNIGTQN